MKPILTDFFSQYPLEGKLKIAIKMVKKKLHKAKECLDKDDESEDYMIHLADAYRMLDAIFTEMGKHPDMYR